MTAEVGNRVRKVSDFFWRGFDLVLDRIHNEERGSLDDEEKMFSLSILIKSASQRIWVRGKLDPRVNEILEKASPNVSPKVDRRTIDSDEPFASMVVDDKLVAFDFGKFLLMWTPPKKFLGEFEKPFDQKK